jgi:hypothetical protein
MRPTVRHRAQSTGTSLVRPTHVGKINLYETSTLSTRHSARILLRILMFFGSNSPNVEWCPRPFIIVDDL